MFFLLLSILLDGIFHPLWGNLHLREEDQGILLLSTLTARVFNWPIGCMKSVISHVNAANALECVNRCLPLRYTSAIVLTAPNFRKIRLSFASSTN